MRPLLASAPLLALLLVAHAALAGDPAAAREQLKQGYALKGAGRCEEAVPHFVESERLDPQPKTLINLAECQEKLHQLVDAEQNLVEARDLAARPEHATLRDIAVRRLAALELRLPRLSITLSPAGGAEHVEVLRDGTMLGSVSLGTPLPTNPGKHTVVVRAEGRIERTYEVSLAEGEQQQLAVSPGEAIAAAPATPVGAPPSATPILVSREEPALPVPSSGRRTLALVVGSLGAASIATGAVFGGVSMYEYGQSSSGCNAANQCYPDAFASRQSSLRHGDFATGFMVAGAVGVAAGAVLWVTAPSDRTSGTARVGVAASGTSLALRGRW
jgi:hypothetical protein